MSRVDRLRDRVEQVTGVAWRPLAEVNRLEEAEVELRGKQRELQDLAYTVMDYAGGSPTEMKAQERRKLAQRARVIHQQDPQYGGTVNLLNEFVLGRGVPKPQAVDEEVQKVIDRFWDDHDNQRVLTSHSAQIRFNTDLSLQSNVFPLVYDDGDDGAVKLGLLDHDTVENAVRDDDARLRVLYYFTKSHAKTWDVNKHAYVVSQKRELVRYYEDFQNLQDAKRDDADGLRKEPLPQIPPNLVGRGRVLHVSINRTLEQAFGVPEIARTIRWLTAYNDLMRARVDMAKAAASIIMRRKLKGGAAAMQQLASQALMAAGGSATAPPDPLAMGQAPRPGSVLEENDFVEHSAMNLSSGSAGAMQDAQMIRSQYSVGTGWPQSYLGDPSATGLSTATSLELRVLKMVETRQQVLEDTIGALVQRAIERAVAVGILDRFRPMTDEERNREVKAAQDAQAAATDGAPMPVTGPSPAAIEARKRHGGHVLQETGGGGRGGGGTSAGSEDVSDVFDVDLAGPPVEPPEGYVARELEFQVSMPSPLRRAMTDLVTSLSTIAKTFDPNNTNLELSKLLLGIALGEALEVEDPGAAVERVFPEGYVDPAVAAAMAAGGQADPSLPPGGFTPTAAQGAVGADGQRHANPDNPYGAPQAARPPELSMQQALMEAFADRRVVTLHSRDGEPIPSFVQEAILSRAGRRQIPTANGQAVAAEVGAERSQLSDVTADTLLGPALTKALALVASAQ